MINKLWEKKHYFVTQDCHAWQSKKVRSQNCPMELVFLGSDSPLLYLKGK